MLSPVPGPAAFCFPVVSLLADVNTPRLGCCFRNGCGKPNAIDLVGMGMIWQCVKTNSTPVVHIKIAGKWMFIPLKMVLIGIDPYPYLPICDIYGRFMEMVYWLWHTKLNQLSFKGKSWNIPSGNLT